ncbi:tail fiber protein [Shigella flexneri]|nr:tail fiber protein [Shigella flexneri]
MSHKVSVGGGSQVNGALGIGVQNALGGNSIVLGDNDTGFKQNGDGILDVYANSQRVFRWICPYISRHLLSLNPLQARCRRYSRGER